MPVHAQHLSQGLAAVAAAVGNEDEAAHDGSYESSPKQTQERLKSSGLPLGDASGLSSSPRASPVCARWGGAMESRACRWMMAEASNALGSLFGTTNKTLAAVGRSSTNWKNAL